jgi:hypothetical protein
MSETSIMLWGAAGFGFVIGWYVYYINRYRKGDVQLSDVVTLIGIIGGAGITKLFAVETPLFGAYGMGLAAGFFTYFVVLIFLVGISKNFRVDWFLDGRRKKVATDEFIPEYVNPTVSAMDAGDRPVIGGQ